VSQSPQGSRWPCSLIIRATQQPSAGRTRSWRPGGGTAPGPPRGPCRLEQTGGVKPSLRRRRGKALLVSSKQSGPRDSQKPRGAAGGWKPGVKIKPQQQDGTASQAPAALRSSPGPVPLPGPRLQPAASPHNVPWPSVCRQSGAACPAWGAGEAPAQMGLYSSVVTYFFL